MNIFEVKLTCLAIDRNILSSRSRDACIPIAAHGRKSENDIYIGCILLVNSMFFVLSITKNIYFGKTSIHIYSNISSDFKITL